MIEYIEDVVKRLIIAGKTYNKHYVANHSAGLYSNKNGIDKKILFIELVAALNAAKDRDEANQAFLKICEFYLTRSNEQSTLIDQVRFALIDIFGIKNQVNAAIGLECKDYMANKQNPRLKKLTSIAQIKVASQQEFFHDAAVVGIRHNAVNQAINAFKETLRKQQTASALVSTFTNIQNPLLAIPMAYDEREGFSIKMYATPNQVSDAKAQPTA